MRLELPTHKYYFFTVCQKNYNPGDSYMIRYDSVSNSCIYLDFYVDREFNFADSLTVQIAGKDIYTFLVKSNMFLRF